MALNEDTTTWEGLVSLKTALNYNEVNDGALHSLTPTYPPPKWAS